MLESIDEFVNLSVGEPYFLVVGEDVIECCPDTNVARLRAYEEQVEHHTLAVRDSVLVANGERDVEGTLACLHGDDDRFFGDYSAISVDPVDDCTFWYTNEYLKSSGSFNWSTRIANFKFPGCSGTADFSLSATPPSRTVTQGQGTSYTVTVTPSNGFSGTVGFNVSGLPAGAGATFNPTTVTGSGNTTMSVTTTTTTAVGTYPLTITGTSGTLSHTTNVTLVVNAPADFSLSATPPSWTILYGGSTTYTITITPSGEFNGTVGFNVSGLPVGATATFNPTTVTGSGNTTMNVTTTTTTAVGTYSLTITGTSGSLAHSAQVTLVIVSHP